MGRVTREVARAPPACGRSGSREEKCEASAKRRKLSDVEILRFAQDDKTRGSERSGLGLGT
jgi:hypothetical protein